ncbi:VOC family protein [Streptomyces sp. DH12]|uniref:VOC family protein n=1 Tax=Streptomyces sp. DH12 TaxID=2857010 RepID=UPI001E3F9A2C|nr:VOC family protein [Streptomyces sp. DH12]
MAVQPEGMPCWADAMFTDVEGAKRFYADVLGWTFGHAQTEYGDYVQAYADGRAVAAVAPPMPGQDGGTPPPAWCLYLASPDVEATARKVRENGGEVLMEPMAVGDFGSMLLARDPGGVTFGVWQAGTHEGFEARAVPGAYCWAEVYTRDVAASDAFFPAVFPFTVKRLEDDHMDFKVFELDDAPVLGRMLMDGDFPAEVSPYVNVYFTVDDVDAAIGRATTHGGKVVFGPMDSPFGRFAALLDPQGAAFSLIDVARTEGEMPALTADS